MRPPVFFPKEPCPVKLREFFDLAIRPVDAARRPAFPAPASTPPPTTWCPASSSSTSTAGSRRASIRGVRALGIPAGKAVADRDAKTSTSATEARRHGEILEAFLFFLPLDPRQNIRE